jgi:hypothetical protein
MHCMMIVLDPSSNILVKNICKVMICGASHFQKLNYSLNVMSWYKIQKPYYVNVPEVVAINEPKSVTFDDVFKIVIILDESGSMDLIRHQMIKAINDLVMEQKQIKERPATFTLVKFSDKVKEVIVNKLLTNVNSLTNADYMPEGSTALYDAIGQTIVRFRNEKNVLMVIVTDGQENASKKYTRNQINKMIDDKKKNNDWTYVYLSSDINTEIQGNNIGLQSSATSSNCQVNMNSFDNFIGTKLNKAISNFRQKGISVQSQI